MSHPLLQTRACTLVAANVTRIRLDASWLSRLLRIQDFPLAVARRGDLRCAQRDL